MTMAIYQAAGRKSLVAMGSMLPSDYPCCFAVGPIANLIELASFHPSAATYDSSVNANRL